MSLYCDEHFVPLQADHLTYGPELPALMSTQAYSDAGHFTG